MVSWRMEIVVRIDRRAEVVDELVAEVSSLQPVVNKQRRMAPMRMRMRVVFMGGTLADRHGESNAARRRDSECRARLRSTSGSCFPGCAARRALPDPA